MMDGNLYQIPELSTSSLPPSVLMSSDHDDPKATGHCAVISHTHSQIHLGNNPGSSELRRERNQYIVWKIHPRDGCCVGGRG